MGAEGDIGLEHKLVHFLVVEVCKGVPILLDSLGGFEIYLGFHSGR